MTAEQEAARVKREAASKEQEATPFSLRLAKSEAATTCPMRSN